jgi:hypothetical protein
MDITVIVVTFTLSLTKETWPSRGLISFAEMGLLCFEYASQKAMFML